MIKKSVTIGIPAYNESLNIKKLIDSLFKQQQINWMLDKIIIYSDGSTDTTNEIVRSLKYKKLELIASEERKGAVIAQNTIMDSSNSDILVMLNADVLPQNNKMIDFLVKPFVIYKNVGLVSAKVIPLKPDNFFESVSYFSHLTKTNLYESMTKNSLYLCHGRCRAFSKDLYKKIKYPLIIADDAYSYLKCLDLGFDFVYAKEAVVLFRSPKNFADYLRQSRRFVKGMVELEKVFGKERIKKEYKISLLTSFKIWIRSLILKPHLTISYLFILLISIFSLKLESNNINHVWAISYSSKKL